MCSSRGFSRPRFAWLALIAAATASLVITVTPTRAVTVYQVGNSLTNNSNPDGIAAMARLAGFEVTNGYHIRGNSHVEEIWDDPDGAGILFNESVGRFPTALPGQAWDHVVIQATDNGNLTLEEDVAGIKRFRDLARENPANADTQFYMYGPWPWSFRWWGWDAVRDEDERSWYMREYFDDLLVELDETMPGDFNYIPTGEVFNTIRERLDGEAFNGRTSISSFYSDAIHANNLGRYVAATTAFATIFRTNPVGLPVPRDQPGWGTNWVPDDIALEIQEVVWEVVSQDPRTGVIRPGDFNIDTFVDEVDLQILMDSFGAQTALTADANGDGRVDSDDVLVWLEASEPDIADLNGDGALDSIDFGLLRAAYGSTGVLDADTNGDGTVDAADYTIVRDKSESLRRSDFNQNGVADADDLALIQSQLGWASHLPADANSDGVVDNADFLIWQANQDVPGTSSVPEPTSSAIGALGCLLLAARRRVA